MRAITISAMALITTACIPVMDWESVPLDQAYQTDKELIIVPGDRVRVHRNGDVYIFKVTQTDAKGFYGVARDDKKYRMNYADLDSMEVIRGGVANLMSNDWGKLGLP